MRLLATLLLCVLLQPCVSQELSGETLLDKAIAYHDPNNQWQTFSGTLPITMEMPEKNPRKSSVTIDLPKESFRLVVKQDSKQTTYTVDKGNCHTTITDSIAGKRTPCETANLYKNYYTYLYGLPMKLKDPGTHLAEKAKKITFKGTPYWMLEVTYDKDVGSDVWRFYFNPQTFAMEVYQFFKGNPDAEGKNTGEYILLTEETVINSIIFPKNRAWYYNKDDGYLAVDVLN